MEVAGVKWTVNHRDFVPVLIDEHVFEPVRYLTSHEIGRRRTEGRGIDTYTFSNWL